MQQGMSAGMAQGQAQPAGATPQAQQAAQPRARAPRPRFQPVPVEEVIESEPVSCQIDETVETAISKMRESDIGSVIVVDDRQPVGILTDRKIAITLAEKPDIAGRQVEELISGDLVTGTPEMSLFDAIDRLVGENIRRLPVVDDDGNLVGVVERDDILVVLTEQLSNATEVIRAQSPRL
jgi:CBS domain-containing protein